MSKDGVTSDLGTLPGGASSFAYTINNSGLIVGQSQIGSIDPLTGLPEAHACFWRKGEIVDLGTLGGTESNNNAVNDLGQVVGGALTATPDPFASAPQASCVVLQTDLALCVRFHIRGQRVSISRVPPRRTPFFGRMA